MNKKLVVIDGKSIFYRGYYAMPGLSTKDGTPTGGVYGFAVLALEIIKRIKPDYVCVAWDKSGTNIRKRKEIYPEYKAGRKKPPEDFFTQIPVLQGLLESFSWPFYEADDYEADDIMATLAKKAEAEGIETILVSSDLDLLQAVTDMTKMYALKKGLSNMQEFDPAEYQKKFGVSVEQCVDFKAIMGDGSDNIPGVAGIGKKGAADLLNEYKTLDDIYDNIELIKESTRKKLVASKDMAYLSRQLVTLMTDAPFDLDLKALDMADLDVPKLREDLNKLEFYSLLRQLPAEMSESVEVVEEKKAEAQRQAKAPLVITAKNAKDLAIDGMYAVTIVEEADQQSLYVLSADGTFAKIAAADYKHGLKASIFDNKNAVVMFDIKHTLRQLTLAGQDHYSPDMGSSMDLSIAGFVRNPLMREVTLEGVVSEFSQSHSLGGVDELEADARAYFSLEAMLEVAGLMDAFYADPANSHLTHAYELDKNSIMPLLRTELEGMLLDADYLATMRTELEGEISDLEQTIYGYADTEFNINSPAQMADVLFGNLDLPTTGIKKTKTSFSTAASELAKLKDLHPIIAHISHYREVTKIKSTYVDALPEHQDSDGRIRSILSQTVTATGRLSSRDPNLQNIPVRTELGKRIRNAFIAAPGNKLVSADYSQFELRLAAILSGDEDMIEAFNSDIDIHTLTASQVFGVALEDVSKEMRYNAKAVNFGILYGQGSHGLAQQTGMSYGEAKEFIERYFDKRSALREYIKNLRTLAKEQGYVETMFGRRRPTPDVASSNFMVREGAYRQAINMPIQGTEADLMKMAMIKLEDDLPAEAKQIMQVHDSIIIECPEAIAEDVAKKMQKTMESIHPDLGIKLKVDVEVGSNWGEV